MYGFVKKAGHPVGWLITAACYLPVIAAAHQPMRELLDLDIEELLDVPISITSQFEQTLLQAAGTASRIEPSDWQKRGARDLADAVAHLPSTMILPNLFGSEVITVRGYAQAEPAGLAVLWDGVPLSTFESGTSQFDRNYLSLSTVDHLEVVRGPGSALYGSDAFHGVVSIHSFAPERDITEASLAGGSDGYYDWGARHSTKVGANARLNIAAGGHGQSDQEREFAFADPFTGIATRSARRHDYDAATGVISLQSAPDRESSYRVGFYWDTLAADDFPGLGSRLTGGTSVLRERDLSGNDSDFFMGKFEVGWKHPAGYDMSLSGYHWDQSHTYRAFTPDSRLVFSDADEQQSGLTLTLRRPSATRTDWAVELGARHQRIDDAVLSFRNPATGRELFKSTAGADGLDRSIVNLSFDAVTPLQESEVQLNYGVRFDDYTDVGSHLSPRMGLVYTPDANTAWKLLYGHAFRAPITANIVGVPGFKGNPNLHPETIDTLEVGFLKHTSRSQFGATVFYSRWRDAIVAVPSSDPAFSAEFVNAGKNSARGIELSHRWDGQRWYTDINGSYVHSRNDITNEDYVAFPKTIVNLGVGYRWPRFHTEAFLNNRLYLDMTQGPILATIPDPADLDDYWRADLNITTRPNKQTELFINLRNLFDQENFVPSVNNSAGGIRDEEFSVSLGARIKW